MNFSEKFNNICKDNVVGASIIITKDNNILGQYNYGHSSLENQIKVEDDTIFRIASISKIIVAMAVMKLVEEEKLSLEDDISNILGFKIRNPKYPNIPISVKMLMLHTSSINDGPEDGIQKGYNGVNGYSYFVALKDLLENKESKYYVEDTFANYAPGEKFEYSNFGTGILACIVEAASGILFSEYVNKYILSPLKVDGSFRANEVNNKQLISSTYYYKDNNFVLARTGKSFVDAAYPYHPLKENFRGPAGGLFISMKNLQKIMTVFLNDGKYKDTRILNKETVDLMLQMHYLGPNLEYNSKGLQLKIIDKNIILKGHTGSAYGVSSYMFFSKEENFGVCFIANGGNYQKEIPGLNNIQNATLDLALEFAKVKKNLIKVEWNAISKEVLKGNGKVLLNKSPRIIDNSVYLELIDFANLVNVVPKLVDNKVFIKDKEIILENNLVNLDVTLNSLKIKFEKTNLDYTLYI